MQRSSYKPQGDDVRYTYDGTFTFSGGQNSGLVPNRIRDDQYRLGVNVTTKMGALSPRPGYRHIPITVTTDSLYNGRSYKDIYRTGRFQSLIRYKFGEAEYFIVVISGIIFKVNPKECTAMPIPITDGSTLNEYRTRIKRSFAGKYIVLYDAPNPPVIIDGNTARRADYYREIERMITPESGGEPVATKFRVYEIPFAENGVYLQNRLFVQVGVNEFLASDGDNNNAATYAPLTFEETFADDAVFKTQRFNLGSTAAFDEITAMGYLQIADTSTGYGPLFIATEDTIYTYGVNRPRNQWTTTQVFGNGQTFLDQSQFGAVSLYNAGIVGHRAFTNVNSDLIFLSGDLEVRSLSTGKDEQRKWANTPLSREISSELVYYNKDLASLAVLSYHKNRVFVTTNPRTFRAYDLNGNMIEDWGFQGLAVLELDNISFILQDSKPAWAGVWTGLNVVDMERFDGELYLYSKDEYQDGGVATNELYLMDESETRDSWEGKYKQIKCRVYTRRFGFKSEFIEKEVKRTKLRFSNIRGEFSADIYQRNGSCNSFSEYSSIKHNASYCSTVSDCTPIVTLCPQELPAVDIGKPKDEGCNEATGRSGKFFSEKELMIEVSADSWMLEAMYMQASLQSDDKPAEKLACSTDDVSPVQSVKDCKVSNDWSYKVAGNIYG